MPPPFRQVTLAQFNEILQQFNFTRQVNAVHFHHTSSPRHRDFRGHESVVAMFRHHTRNRGFSDIAQHITIAPDGTIFLGRNWNRPPASAVSNNGTSQRGPFMFETVGDFNVGEDPFRDPQRRTVLSVIALVQQKFGLPPGALRFHRELSSTDCPGSSLEKDEIVRLVTELHSSPGGPPLADPLAALSEDERAGDRSFDVEEVLREFDRPAPAAVQAEEAPVDEEDTHDEIPPEAEG